MNIQNGLDRIEDGLTEERDLSAEFTLNEVPVIGRHGDDNIRLLEQFVSQLPRPMPAGVNPALPELLAQQRKDRLIRRLDTGRSDDIGGRSLKVGLQRIFRHHAAEDVAGAHEKDRLGLGGRLPKERAHALCYTDTEASVSRFSHCPKRPHPRSPSNTREPYPLFLSDRVQCGSMHSLPSMPTPTETVPIRSRSQSKQTLDVEKLHTRLCRLVGTAIADYGMVEDGDHVMVCLSGGKDSYGLLDILISLQQRAPVRFTLTAVNLDQKQPGFPAHVLPDYLTQRGIPFRIETRDTYSIVKRLIPEGDTTCSLCSRLRRGHLYRVASELGATKIALGHHRDDILETFLLNLFFGGKLKAMPPKLRSKDGRHIVIRPLAYVPESDLVRYAALKQFPLIPCDLCGSQEHLRRKAVKSLLQELGERFPGSIDTMFASLSNVAPSLLLDRRLFDFAGLSPLPSTPTGTVDALLIDSDKDDGERLSEVPHAPDTDMVS